MEHWFQFPKFSVLKPLWQALARVKCLTTPRTYWFTLRLETPRITSIMLCTIAAASFQGAALLSLVPLLNQASGGKSQSTFLNRAPDLIGGRVQTIPIGALICFFLLFGALATIFKYLSEILLARYRGSIERKLTEKMMDAICEIAWNKFVDLRLGGLAQAILTNGGRFADGSEKLVRALSSITIVALLFSLALWNMPISTMVLAATVSLGVIGHRRIFWKFAHFSEERTKASIHFAEVSIETIANWKYLKATGIDRESLRKIAGASCELETKQVASMEAASSLNLSLEFAAIFAVALCFYYGLLWGGVNINELIVLVGIFARITPPLLASQGQYNAAKNLQFGATSWLNLFQSMRSGATPSKGRLVPTFECQLEMRDVGYEYSQSSGVRDWRLREINWKLSKGGFLAIIGESGTGKSTLLDLVTGLAHPTSGEVLLDGIPLAQLDIRAWRQQIGIVPQNCPLFYGTVIENVALGVPVPDPVKVLRCLEMAQAMSFIAAFPNGIATNIGDSGNKLSGGQRQRIAIARALYRDPWLLILDEATNSLDSENEISVMATIAQLKRKIAIILVTHRLEVASIADEIIMLNQGTISKRGSWSQLQTGRPQKDSYFESLKVTTQEYAIPSPHIPV